MRPILYCMIVLAIFRQLGPNGPEPRRAEELQGILDILDDYIEHDKVFAMADFKGNLTCRASGKKNQTAYPYGGGELVTVPCTVAYHDLGATVQATKFGFRSSPETDINWYFVEVKSGYKRSRTARDEEQTD
jgi:hypothetical protein